MKATPLKLSNKVKHNLKKIIKAHTSETRMVRRAKIIYLSAQGYTNIEIAHEAGCSEQCVIRWKRRFNKTPSIKTLKDALGRGRKSKFSAEVKYGIIKIACSPLNKEYVQRGEFRWTLKLIQEELYNEYKVKVSKSLISLILNENNLRPHKIKMWQHSPDPEFKKKVKAIVDLYLDPTKDAEVICVDEKSGIQAIERKHWQKKHQVRLETEYKRHGTGNLFAAFNVYTGNVFSKPTLRRTQKDLNEYMKELIKKYPKKKLYIIWDNLNTHLKWDRLHKNDRITCLYTPIHASWVNQIEIWFGVLYKKVLKNASFKNIFHMLSRIMEFAKNWNKDAHPFKWKFSGYKVS